MTRSGILDAAKQIVTKDRNARYGEPEDNFSVIAECFVVCLCVCCCKRLRLVLVEEEPALYAIEEDWDATLCASLFNVFREDGIEGGAWVSVTLAVRLVFLFVVMAKLYKNIISWLYAV